MVDALIFFGGILGFGAALTIYALVVDWRERHQKD
jgi:hypothetical protein